MEEIKALKKFARDQANERDALVKKTEKDAAIISRMLEEALAKEDELGCLRTTLETLQSERPDAFVINGACVPGVPVALIKSNGENGDAVHIDNIENLDEVIRTILATLIHYHLEVRCYCPEESYLFRILLTFTAALCSACCCQQ